MEVIVSTCFIILCKMILNQIKSRTMSKGDGVCVGGWMSETAVPGGGAVLGWDSMGFRRISE